MIWMPQTQSTAGLGAVASYGFVSNATYGTGTVSLTAHIFKYSTLRKCFNEDDSSSCMLSAGMAISWIAFVKRTGKSPLMAGQWKPFLAFFAGELPPDFTFL